MRIGVYFSPIKGAGGVYQYSVAFLEALSNIRGHKYVVIAASKDIPAKIRKLKNFEIIDSPPKISVSSTKISNNLSFLISYFSAHFLNFWFLTPLYRYGQKEMIKKIEGLSLDLMFYPTSSNLSFLAKTPSLVAVHDLQHRISPQFKEVSAGGRWENREYVYRNISKKAFRIFVDSEIGKRDIVKYYQTNPKKVIILPFLPPSYLDAEMSLKSAEKICRSLNLPKKFIFYPANFWPHKNHMNLIKALHKLKSQGREVNLVLTGSKDSDFSSYEDIASLVDEYGLRDQVFILGYVSSRKISALYKVATTMVMPTYFGPTNIPVLEAWKMGTPVIYSDLRGCREQLGNAGLLINPDSPSDIADKILKVYTHPKLAAKLIKRGCTRINKWSFKDFSNKIREIINEYQKNTSEKDYKNRAIPKQRRT